MLLFSQSKYVCARVLAAGGSSEDIGALSLALQIINASEDLQETVAHLKKLRPGVPDKHADQTQPEALGRLWSHSVMLLSVHQFKYCLINSKQHATLWTVSETSSVVNGHCAMHAEQNYCTTIACTRHHWCYKIQPIMHVC